MPTARVVIAGEPETGAALAEFLRERGVAADYHTGNGLAETFVVLERHLEEGAEAAVAVGTGEAAVTLAITAAKGGIPLARTAGGDWDPDRARILATLAELDAGPETGRAADLIAAWLRGEPPPADLD